MAGDNKIKLHLVAQNLRFQKKTRQKNEIEFHSLQKGQHHLQLLVSQLRNVQFDVRLHVSRVQITVNIFFDVSETASSNIHHANLVAMAYGY